MVDDRHAKSDVCQLSNLRSCVAVRAAGQNRRHGQAPNATGRDSSSPCPQLRTWQHVVRNWPCQASCQLAFLGKLRTSNCVVRNYLLACEIRALAPLLCVGSGARFALRNLRPCESCTLAPRSAGRPLDHTGESALRLVPTAALRPQAQAVHAIRRRREPERLACYHGRQADGRLRWACT